MLLDLEAILDRAETWVREIGQMQLERLCRKDFTVTSKSSAIDLVTEVDRLSEERLLTAIRTVFPEHGILAEESGATASDSEYRWVVDPLDGTVNYTHGFPVFSISVALQFKGETQLGLVYVPAWDEFYAALRGKGAFLNGRRLQVAPTGLLNQAILATGFPYDRATDPDNNVKYFTQLITKVQGIRRTGSAAFDLCNVAAGRFDGYWELKLNLWDIAAGVLLVREAGGEVIELDYARGKGIALVAANTELARVIVKELQRADS